MRILVAGWHGQIALALSQAAALRGDVEAYAVGRPALDLTDRPSIGRTLFGIRPDVIINTAAYTDVEGAESEPEIAFRRNTTGAAALAAQARHLGIPVIHLSTVYVFDGEKDSAYKETDVVRPINAYGHSKLEGERAVAKANPRHVILRTGWVFSTNGHNFVSTMLARSRTDQAIDVVDDQRGSPTYAPHLASAILDIAARLISDPAQSLWGTYHAANGGGPATWLDIAGETLACARSADTATAASPKLNAISMSDFTYQAPRPRNAALDCAKLGEPFGFRLPDWRDGVAACVDALKSPTG